MTDIQPRPGAENWRIAIAVAQFNPTITGMLLDGARHALAASGVDDANLEIHEVPGAWELPLACQYLARSGKFDAVLAIGAVVRGETAHFEFISAECARGLQQVALATDVPVAFGVLTPESRAQALERADPKRKNKGREVALAALDMIALRSKVSS
jgi:6,7-dimethyl-8-ribityllumazine synthase